MSKPRLWDLDDLAGTAELAARYGVNMPAISNWSRRYSSFPKPLTHISKNPVYSVAQVDAWYASNPPRRRASR